jgi:SPP1 Gp6-like portal protein
MQTTYYDTALDLKRPAPSWVKNPDEAARVLVFDTYEEIYNNVSEAFAAVLRSPDGEELSYRYVPAARTIVEATNRFLAKNPQVITEVPADVAAPPDDVMLTNLRSFKDFLKREAFGPKFLAMKRWTLVKGDGFFHITADPSKPEGSRLRLSEVSAQSVFPLTDPIDNERVIGVYLVTIVVADDNTTELAQRIEYRKIRNADDAAEFGVPVNSIFYRVSYFEPDGWDDRAPLLPEDLKPVEPPEWAAVPEGGSDYLAGFALPAQITTIPVYHFRNRREGTELWGRSELQGLETLFAGVIQGASDEDLAISLHGIGVYTTDSGQPVDEKGVKGEWVIAPASVLELQPGSNFTRVPGVTSVQPMLDHIDMLEGQARETSGTPDIAIGKVDVAVAESGVALALQMSPVLAKNSETEEEFKAILDQMFYDITTMWFPAYETTDFGGVTFSIVFGDPLPVDRKAIIEEVTSLVDSKVIPIRFALQILKDKLGYDIDPVAMAAEVQKEQSALLDAAAARVDAALNAEGAAGAVPPGSAPTS